MDDLETMLRRDKQYALEVTITVQAHDEDDAYQAAMEGKLDAIVGGPIVAYEIAEEAATEVEPAEHYHRPRPAGPDVTWIVCVCGGRVYL